MGEPSERSPLAATARLAERGSHGQGTDLIIILRALQREGVMARPPIVRGPWSWPGSILNNNTARLAERGSHGQGADLIIILLALQREGVVVREQT